MSFHPRRGLVRALFLTLIFLPFLSEAQQAPADERWYQVEVIVFAQKNKGHQTSEVWPIDVPMPEIEKSRELGKGRVDTSNPTTSRPRPFSRVTLNSLQLQNTAQRIRAGDDLELVMHTGWVQPGLAEDQAVAIHFFEGLDGDDPEGAMASSPRLDGTLRLILARYLHLETDLIWRDPATTEAPVNAEGTGPLQNSYRLVQSRRMRSKEVHYIDHPRFGLIVLATPYNNAE